METINLPKESNDCKINHNYNWGEFYETLLEMKQKGDTTENEIFEKCSQLFTKLDNATNIIQIREIITETPLTDYEQNYINSSCLDGILLSAKVTYPMTVLAKSKKDYIETCKYYLSKKVPPSIYNAIKYGNLKMLELFFTNKIKKANISLSLSGSKKRQCTLLEYATYKGQTEVAKFLIENGEEIEDTFDKYGGYGCYIAQKGNFELVKYIFEKYRNEWGGYMLINALIHRRTEIVKFLIENNVLETMDIYELDLLHENMEYCYDSSIWKLLYDRGFILDIKYLEDLISRYNFTGIYFVLEKLDTIPKEIVKQVISVFSVRGVLIETKEHISLIINLLIRNGVSADDIIEAIGPAFYCAKALLETKYTLQEK